MTNYATKDDIKMHQVVIKAAILKLCLDQEHAESLPRREHDSLNDVSQNEQMGTDTDQSTSVDWSKFALKLYNRFARECEISSVTIANHLLQQPAFFLLLGE